MLTNIVSFEWAVRLYYIIPVALALIVMGVALKGFIQQSKQEKVELEEVGEIQPPNTTIFIVIYSALVGIVTYLVILLLLLGKIIFSGSNPNTEMRIAEQYGYVKEDVNYVTMLEEEDKDLYDELDTMMLVVNTRGEDNRAGVISHVNVTLPKDEGDTIITPIAEKDLADTYGTVGDNSLDLYHEPENIDTVKLVPTGLETIRYSNGAEYHRLTLPIEEAKEFDTGDTNIDINALKLEYRPKGKRMYYHTDEVETYHIIPNNSKYTEFTIIKEEQDTK